VLYILKKEPYAIANTPGGRVYLNRFVMDSPEEMVTHPINLNTLDNRKCNLEHKVVEIPGAAEDVDAEETTETIEGN